MRKTIAVLYTYVEFFVVALVFIGILGLAAILTRSDPIARIRGRWMRRLGRVTTKLTPMWRFRMTGKGPDDIQERGYMVVSNHESFADMFLLAHAPWDMRWIFKAELFKAPIIRWLLRFSGDIPLVRGNGDSIRTMLGQCRETLQKGLSIMIFPEGTRSRDGRLLPFKDGAFSLAIETQSPVLPIALAGTRECVQKGALVLNYAHGRAHVLEPVSTEGMTPEDLPRLKRIVRDRIREGVRELRAELGIPVGALDATEPPVASGSVDQAA